MSMNTNGYDELHHSSGSDGGMENPPMRTDRTDDGSAGAHAAAQLLEKTARETDRWRAEATDEATVIVATAREEAAQLVRAAREEAEHLVASARVEASRVREAMAAARRRDEEEIARLDQVADAHRERLRQHLTEMLDLVDRDDRVSGADGP